MRIELTIVSFLIFEHLFLNFGHFVSELSQLVALVAFKRLPLFVLVEKLLYKVSAPSANTVAGK